MGVERGKHLELIGDGGHDERAELGRLLMHSMPERNPGQDECEME